MHGIGRSVQASAPEEAGRRYRSFAYHPAVSLSARHGHSRPGASSKGGREMGPRVVGAGVGRTGTGSLKLALERLLGAPCYHAYELTTNHLEHVPLWHEAVRGGEPDWDGIYRDFAATVDWPGAAFWRPLAHAYPDSLVLLSTRETEKWFRSVDATLIDYTKRTGSQEVSTWAPEMQAWWSMIMELFDTRFTPAPFDEHLAKLAYERHNAEVR